MLNDPDRLWDLCRQVIRLAVLGSKPITNTALDMERHFAFIDKYADDIFTVGVSYAKYWAKAFPDARNLADLLGE